MFHPSFLKKLAAVTLAVKIILPILCVVNIYRKGKGIPARRNITGANVEGAPKEKIVFLQYMLTIN